MNMIALDKEESDEDRRLFRETNNEENDIIKSNSKEEEKINIIGNKKEEKEEKEEKLINKKSDGEKDEEDNPMKIRFFFIKFYLYLLIQYIFIGLFSFLGFYIGFDEFFSFSSGMFWSTLVIISLFSMYLSLFSVGLEKEKSNKLKYFLVIVYVPIMIIYIFLLKTHKGVDIIEGKYFIYQIIIFALNCLISILYHLIFPFYKGWLNCIFLVAINILAMIIYCYPISENYEDLKVSHNGLVGLSIISMLMIIFLIIFNFEILDKEKSLPIHFTIQLNYLPFIIALSVLVMVFLIIAQVIGHILLILLFALYAVIMFFTGLFGRN